MGNIENKKYWNIVKAISIISIVIGHSCHFLVKYVYLYHLAIFFFLTGYFYNEKKYSQNPYLYFLSKIKANWKKFVIFSTFFILIHNLLVNMGLIENGSIYYIKDYVVAFCNSLVFNIPEVLAGALWFVPVYIIASSIFGIMVYYSSILSNKKEKIQNCLLVVFTLLMAVFSICITKKNVQLPYHMQTSFLVVPFYSMGYFLRKYCVDVFKYLKIYIFIPVILLLYYSVNKLGVVIELSANIIDKWYLFYFVSILGFYFCMYISKILFEIKWINNLFDLIGRYTFEIMALHFLVFKIIDFAWARIKNIEDVSIYGKFPYAFGNFWPMYIILGTILPVLICNGIYKLKEFIKDKVNKKLVES